MKFIRRYLLPRVVQYVLVIVLGITAIFLIPRLLPSDPVEATIDMISGQTTNMNPEAAKRTVAILREMYGLEQGLFRQYLSFWRRLLTGDFGPSLFQFPTPVMDLIGRALPWTLGLLLVTTLSSWLIGTTLGGLAGYFTKSRILKVVDAGSMFLRPIPYYVLALTLVILFAYLIPIFPLSGGYTVGMKIAFSWRFIWDVLKSAFLPALSLTLSGAAISHQTMRLVVESVKDEDYIRYAKIAAVNESAIWSRYVMRNAILPQITSLALSLGQIFGGALITEMVFAYPGIGYLLYRAIIVSDYNLIMGITTISIIGIISGMLVIDLLYPLFDPRIRLR